MVPNPVLPGRKRKLHCSIEDILPPGFMVIAQQSSPAMTSKTPDHRAKPASIIGLRQKKPHEIALTILFLILCSILLLGIVIAIATNEALWNELTKIVRD